VRSGFVACHWPLRNSLRRDDVKPLFGGALRQYSERCSDEETASPQRDRDGNFDAMRRDPWTAPRGRDRRDGIPSRRDFLANSLRLLGLSLPQFLSLRKSRAAEVPSAAQPRAKSCIVLFCWGGISHYESWDPKPEAPSDIRGEFRPIPTATPGIHVSEHLPFLARQTERLAIIRSMRHTCGAHGKAMYWNMTGHPPPQPRALVNRSPTGADWPSLGAVFSKLHPIPKGVLPAVRLPYPLVDNGTLQAGEYGGWLGQEYDPIVVRTPGGKAFEGRSRDLGSLVFDSGDALDRARLYKRLTLSQSFGEPLAPTPGSEQFD
jgi:hypothetical protein